VNIPGGKRVCGNESADLRAPIASPYDNDLDPGRLEAEYGEILDLVEWPPPGCQNYGHGLRDDSDESGIIIESDVLNAFKIDSYWPCAVSMLLASEERNTLKAGNASLRKFCTSSEILCSSTKWLMKT
jgi:hypothetical protein